MRDDRPSATALTIALGLLWLGRRDPGIVAAEDIRILEGGLRRLGGAASAGAALARGPFGGLLFRAVEAAVVPGIIIHYALRKRAIERIVRDSLSDGFRQLVVIAAGYDLLAARLAGERGDLSLIELDHPSTQRAKAALLEGSRRPRLVPVDLAKTSVRAALRSCPGFDPAAPTIFVVEGLTMYLSAAALEALWRELAAGPEPRARLVCTFMEPGPDGRARFRRQSGILGGFLALSGERFGWGAALGDIAPILRRCGWSLASLTGPEEFRALALAAGPMHARHEPVGEYILAADRAVC